MGFRLPLSLEIAVRQVCTSGFLLQRWRRARSRGMFDSTWAGGRRRGA
jgi:hypothetical protein